MKSVNVVLGTVSHLIRNHDNLLRSCIDRLSETNKSRVLRKMMASDRWMSVIGERMALDSLSRLHRSPRTSLTWERSDRYSKPFAISADGSRLDGVSISHDSNIVFTATILDEDVGIDAISLQRCMSLCEDEGYKKIGLKFFPLRINSLLSSSDADTRPELFGIHWSVMESVVKLFGSTIHSDLRKDLMNSLVSQYSPKSDSLPCMNISVKCCETLSLLNNSPDPVNLQDMYSRVIATHDGGKWAGVSVRVNGEIPSGDMKEHIDAILSVTWMK